MNANLIKIVYIYPADVTTRLVTEDANDVADHVLLACEILRIKES